MISLLLDLKQSGNCLYSSVSISIIGDNSLVDDLRLATSIEFFLFATFYCKHPIFLSVYADHKEKVFKSYNNMISMSVLHEALDTNNKNEELVRAEAILNCMNNRWSCFFFFLFLHCHLSPPGIFFILSRYRLRTLQAAF